MKTREAKLDMQQQVTIDGFQNLRIGTCSVIVVKYVGATSVHVCLPAALVEV